MTKKALTDDISIILVDRDAGFDTGSSLITALDAQQSKLLIAFLTKVKSKAVEISDLLNDVRTSTSWKYGEPVILEYERRIRFSVFTNYGNLRIGGGGRNLSSRSVVEPALEGFFMSISSHLGMGLDEGLGKTEMRLGEVISTGYSAVVKALRDIERCSTDKAESVLDGFLAGGDLSDVNEYRKLVNKGQYVDAAWHVKVTWVGDD